MPKATTSAISVNVGRQIRAIREHLGVSQDTIALAARRAGCQDWTRATVAAIEVGRREVSLAEFAALKGDAERWAELNPRLGLFATIGQKSAVADSLAERLDAEMKAARKLKRSPRAVVAAAYKLWGRSLTEERDSRVAANSEMDESARAYWRARHDDVPKRDARTTQAARGHISRSLLATLEEEIKRPRGRR